MGALQTLDIPQPAFFGLAKDRREFPLGPEWAAEANNIVIDSTGRISARKGWEPVNSSTIDGGADIVQIHEYIAADGTSLIISTTSDDIFEGTTSPVSRKGALTPSAGNWKFVNFNGKVLGWQAAHTPIVKTGAGNFAAISASSGTLPDGNTALAAFGRVWAVDDDTQTIRYSALLDETAWDPADGGGSIDMRSVWSQGMDQVVAIVAYGSNLVVFGKRHIVIWTDGSGSQIGIDPENMYVTDSIEGVGAVARDAVVLVGEIDVAFWSESGIRSLARTIQERATPAADLSPMNRNYIATGKTSGTLSAIRSAYSPQEGLILFTAPVRDLIFVFDVRQPIPEGAYRMTEWALDPTALAVTVSGTLYLGFPGDIAEYTGYLDDGASYPFMLESGWVNIKGDSGRKQALKALKGFFFTEEPHLFQIQWGVDFGSLSSVIGRIIGEEAVLAEWGEAEWGEAQFGAQGAVRDSRLPLGREAEFFKFRISTVIDGRVVALQPLRLYSKPLRLA